MGGPGSGRKKGSKNKNRFKGGELGLTKKSFTTKDAKGLEFHASMTNERGQKRYSAFNGKVTAGSLKELKKKVSDL
jgi:hypothetical protein